MKRTSIALAAASLAAVVGTAVAAPAPAFATGCSTAWGSTAEHAGSLSRAHISTLRTGSHACFDRMVVDLTGTTAGYRVQYVNQVRSEGSGNVVPLRGGAHIQVTVLAPIGSRIPAMPSTAGMRTFRQLAYAGSFEGQTTFGLGVRARLPFRVFVIGGTTPKVVVDVAHTW